MRIALPDISFFRQPTGSACGIDPCARFGANAARLTKRGIEDND